MDSIFMKKGVLLFLVFRFLLNGIEEYMIIPTAWLYIKSLGETQTFLGIVLASYGAGIVAFTPVLGKIIERYRRPKLILLVCHALRTCGNALYSVSSSPYYALIGRFLCGVSASSDVLLLRELARTTSAKHRAKIFVLLDGIYTLGCGLGPTFATILTFHFNIYTWQITAENSPGFVLAVIWLVLFLFNIVLPMDFSEDEDRSERQLVLTPDGFIEETVDPQKTAVKRSKVLCLVSFIFFIWFFASVTGFYTPLLATEIFHLDQFHVNLLFGNALLLQMVLYLLFYISGDKLNERVLLLLAMVLQAVPLSILGVYGLNWTDHLMYLLLVYVVIGTPLIAFTLACSLLAKITKPELTGYYQRLSYTSLYIATILGRVVPAFFFAKTLLGWLALQLGFLWLMMTASYTVVFFMQY